MMWSFLAGFFHFAWCFQFSHVCNTYQYFIAFYGSLKSHCMTIWYCIWPLVSWWTFGFPLLGFYEWLCYEQLYTCFCVDIHFSSSGISGSYGNPMFKLPSCFPSVLYEGSSFSTSFPILVSVRLFNDSHPNGWELVSHCTSDLCFPDD